MLKLMISSIDFQDHEIISVFKSLDANFDGFVSREEIVEGFKMVGVDASLEINAIMNNLDIDKSETLDFTEIKLPLINWDVNTKKKALARVFKAQDGWVEVQDLKHLFPDVLAHEWADFMHKAKAENGRVSLGGMKRFIKEEIIA
jgi:calcium-dependent protein kinase